MTWLAPKIGSSHEAGALRYSCALMAGRASSGDRRWVGAWVWLTAALLLTAPLAWAGTEGEPPKPKATPDSQPGDVVGEAQGEVLVPVQQPEEPPPRNVELDDLLRLPQGFSSDVERRGGATRSEWTTRFETARKDFESAKKKLVQLNAELDKVSESSSAWQVSAPGSNDPQTSPLSIRLRQDMKAQREEIEAAERRLRVLHVEADLAGVPAGWRE